MKNLKKKYIFMYKSEIITAHLVFSWTIPAEHLFSKDISL